MSPSSQEIRLLLDASGMRRALRRMASQITERHTGVEDLALVGIRTNGIYLARRLAREMEAAEGVSVATGVIDVTLYRDDISRGRFNPLVKRTDIPFPVDDRKIILVDDVLFTGRTTRAALDALMDFGRPAQVELAVLVDRGHRELPIRADYVGIQVSTAREESVIVDMQEAGQEDRVFVVRPEGGQDR
ncbi:MAG: bifunctional pyr operon transcriptional regulator/uracil phosphoribosyltransferase PyrR [Thermodesulfobacteriota bacterium]